MDLDKYLKDCSDAKVHSEISKLNNEQKLRVKKFIDEIITLTDRGFTISELKILKDRIDIAINYKLTMF